MSTVDVSPDALRGAGRQLNGTREELAERSNIHMLHGAGGDNGISTAGFPPGSFAQQMLTHQYQRAQEVFRDVSENLIALSSALHIVADVYETADHAQAFEFAFLNPAVTSMDGGAPAWWARLGIRRENNSDVWRQQAAAQDAARGDTTNLPDGWRQEVNSVNPGISGVPTWTFTRVYDADGNLVSRQAQTVYPDGREVTESFDGDGNLTGRTDYVETAGGGSTTSTYNGDGDIQRTETYTVNADGSSNYTVTEPDDQGQPEVVDEFDVGAQPRVDGSDAQTRHLEEMMELGPNAEHREAAREQQEFMEEQLEER